jgi:hypothetical protein
MGGGGSAQVGRRRGRLRSEAWRAEGAGTGILVPSSTRGNQIVAFEELPAAFR